MTDKTVLKDSNFPLEDKIRTLHPDWLVTARQSGSAWWINVMTPEKRAFTIQLTPHDGIGVSERCGSPQLDFAGHDEVFDNIDSAMAFIKQSVNQ
jgi:hypothetical protein